MAAYEAVLEYWKSRSIDNDAELAEIMNGKSISYAYNSGKLENDKITYNDTREIFEHDGVSSYTGDLRTLFEIRNAKNAYELFLEAFADRRSLDEALLKEFQFKLTENTYDERRWKLGERPGEYKKHDYVTGKYEIGALPEDVEEEIRELLEDISSVPEDKILTAAAFFHAKFENIHPFADGNGRTGRLAMNYLLVLNNHPIITIHEEDRKEYYAALEHFDIGLKLDPLIEFLKQQTVKTWGRQLSRGI
ncbi:MAG: Fic family protein [Eubacteriales bacterium]|nr:Fic family protein [Eubacteriales bacterium]